MVSLISVSTLLVAIVAGFFMIINLATEQVILGLCVGVFVLGVLYLAKENRDSLF